MNMYRSSFLYECFKWLSVLLNVLSDVFVVSSTEEQLIVCSGTREYEYMRCHINKVRILNKYLHSYLPWKP